MFQSPGIRLFALIVSIDQYELEGKFMRLSGCVNDGAAMRSFLTEKLKVPETHIKFLCNSYATRDAILDGFESHLLNNDDIQNGDAILIFYAGHGCRVGAPKEWAVGSNKIEAICSYDSETSGMNGRVYVIPDFTLGALFRELARQKGNNIVRHFVFL